MVPIIGLVLIVVFIVISIVLIYRIFLNYRISRKNKEIKKSINFICFQSIDLSDTASIEATKDKKIGAEIMTLFTLFKDYPKLDELVRNISNTHEIHSHIIDNLFSLNVDDITNVGSHHAGIGLTVLGNLKKLHDGKHTLHDFTLNSGEALVSKKVALIAAGKGAALGLHLGPPGALAGFVLGGVLGSSLGSSVVGFFKDAFIYDGIINNCEHYAYSYSPDINNFTELTSKNINKIIQEQEVILNGFNIMKDKITVEKMLPYILIEEMEYFRTYSNEILEEGKNIFINELEVILSKNNIKEDHQDRYIGVALIQHFPKPSGYIASTYVQVNTELYKHKSYPYILQIAHDKMKLLRDLSYQKAMRIAEEDFLQNIEEYVLLQKHPLKFLSWLNVLVFITVILLLVKS